MRNPDDLLILAQKIQRPLERYLKWKQVCDRYERGYKVIIAKNIIGRSAETIRERESLALTSEEVGKYLEDWDKAEKEKIKAQVEYDSLKTSFEALTSALAFDRETMKRGM